MNTNIEEELTSEKPKQYLLMADDITRVLLGKIAPGLQFIQVEGMTMENNSDYTLLANPIQKAVME